jgi:NodT family efflux transporter outer membrane factor (OMF) lipoprotein
MRSVPRAALALACAGLLAAACAAQGPRTPPPALADAGGLAGADAAPPATPVADRWWQAFQDPALDALVDEALAASPTLEAARAHLDAAAGTLRIASGARLPAAEFDAGVERERLSETGLLPPQYGGATVNFGQLGLNLSYELDLFGRVRGHVRAGEAGVVAARDDVAAARLGVASAVARGYLELAHRVALAASLEESIARRRELLALTERRAAHGVDTSVEVEQARAAVASAEGELATSAEDEALLRNQLAALVGAGPARGAAVRVPATLPGVALTIPEHLPADLVGRRADIAAERARVEAARGEVSAAEAAFYPDINLSAALGFQSIELGSLLSASNRTWTVGPALSLPLFNVSQLRGALMGRDADYRAAVARYNDTVIGAYREVADAVASLRALDREQAACRAAVAALDRSAALARERYRAGLADYLTVLSAEDRLLTERRAAIDLEARRAELAVALFRALGGGFSA